MTRGDSFKNNRILELAIRIYKTHVVAIATFLTVDIPCIANDNSYVVDLHSIASSYIRRTTYSIVWRRKTEKRQK